MERCTSNRIIKKVNKKFSKNLRFEDLGVKKCQSFEGKDMKIDIKQKKRKKSLGVVDPFFVRDDE